MTWNAAGVQSNEANKSITAVASVTGGIRVTSAAHGYSDGDFVLISATGYNGSYFIRTSLLTRSTL